MLWIIPLLVLVTEVENSPCLHVSHLASERQGQNPGEVGMFCFCWCFEDWWILSPFWFLSVRPHSGHWFGLAGGFPSLFR